MSAVLLASVTACEFGTATPTPVAKPSPTQAATQVATEAATPTTGTAVEATPSATSVVSGIETPGAGTTPSPRGIVRFATYNLQPSSVNPSLQPYKVEAGLTNVSNTGDFELSAGAKSLIEHNAFAVQFPSGEPYKQFYQLYEDGRYGEKPVFVTTDSVLHVYHLMFDKLLRSTETKYLIQDLRELTDALLDTTQQQYSELKGTAAETAAKRNLAYLAVAAKLIDPNYQIPAEVQTEVGQELKLIDEHAGKAPSAVMGIGGLELMEDYGQYKPRGHYTRSKELEQYFRAMMWYGRITFRLKEPDETRSALLLTQALQSAQTETGVKASDAWANIYEPTTFFVGGADDLTYRDYAPLAEEALGSATDAQAVVDDAKVEKFRELAKTLQGPRINSMFVYIDEDKEQETKGFRLMGQRFTLDAYVFGQLIWREVGVRDDNDTSKQRWLPKGLDFPAALGSDEAYKVLDEMGEVNCPNRCVNYPRQMEKVRGQIKSLPTSQWTENLYWSWLYTFRPLLAPKPADSGYPSFMTNDAWTRKNLNTVLGSWTELKHDTLLYAKQVMAEMGGGPPQITKGYVEPEPEFYARVAALVAMTRDGLLSRGLLEKPADQYAQADFNTLNQLESLALDLKGISEKELEGKALTEDEYSLIKYYGGRLEGITLASADPSESGQPGGDLNDQDAAIVADVASSPHGEALTEATGRIMEIYVVVPIEGNLVLTRGGVYSQYEFVVPTSDRLTDEQWRERLDSGQVPDLGDWKTFIVK
jgi:hypothetical protein